MTMGIMDSFWTTAKSAIDFAGEKTETAIEISKLKMRESQVNSDIRKGYEKIGNLVYNSTKKQVNSDDLVRVCIADIDRLLAELAEIHQQLCKLRKQIKCSKCGMMNPQAAAFCSRCGGDLNAAKPQTGGPMDGEQDEEL